jgi:hypothetical protein
MPETVRIPLAGEQSKPKGIRIPLYTSTSDIAQKVDPDIFAEAERRRATAPGAVPRPQPPDIPVSDRLLGSAAAAIRELAGMPKAIIEQASTLVFNPMNPVYGGEKLAEIGAGTADTIKALQDNPVDYAIENPLTTAGIILAPLAARGLARPGLSRPEVSAPRSVRGLLPESVPPRRSPVIQAEFVDVPPRTYQPERPAISGGIRGELSSPIDAEFVTVRPGFGPQRIPLDTSIHGELPAGPPEPRLLQAAPTVELPGSGGVMRPPHGEPGGILPRNEATITPTTGSTTPRTKPTPASVNVVDLKGRLQVAEAGDKTLARQVNQGFTKLKGKKAAPELQALVKSQQQNRARITELKQQIADIEAPQTVMPAPSSELPQPQPIPTEATPAPVRLGETPSEALTIAARGRRPELLKEGKAFDEQGLVESPLFQGRGGRQTFLGIDERAAAEPKPATPYEAAVDDTARVRMQQFLEEVASGSTEMTGKVKRLDSGEIVGRFGGGIKKLFPELAHFQENPGRIAEAIVKDKGNPLYMRVLEASKEYIDRTMGEEIARAVEAPEGDTSFNFGPESGAVRLDALRPIHNIREAAFDFGERVGQPVIDAIGSAFEKRTPNVFKRLLGVGEYKKPEGYVLARRQRAGQTAALAEEIGHVRDTLLESLPDKNSRVLAARIARNEATTEDFIAAAENPSIKGMAEYVRGQFMDTAERIIGEGVRQYSKLDQVSRDNVLAVIKGEQSIETLPQNLRPYAETGIGRFYGEYLPRLYKSREGQTILKKYGLSRDRVRMELSRLKQRNTDLSPQVRKALGEIEEIVYPAAKGLFQERQMLVDNEFFEKIARDPTLTAANPKLAPQSFAQLPDVDTLGPLAGKWVHPAVHRDLMQMITAPSTVVKYMQKVNGWIKANKTLRNPASHARNIESNYILRDAIGGQDFSSQMLYDVKALKDYKRGGVHFKEAREHGLFGTDYVTLDLSGLDLDSMNPFAADDISTAATFTQRLFDAAKKIDKNAAKWYALEDEIAKLGYYKYLREKKGFNAKQAVDRTFEVIPDYSDVAPVVDWLRKNPIGPTFITFASKVFPAYTRALIKHPVRAGKYIALGEIARRFAAEMLKESEKDQQQEQANLPEYMRPKLGGTFQPFAKLPVKDREGRSQFFDLTYLLPIGDVGETSGFFGGPPEFSLGILPMTIMELGQNTSYFASNIRNQPTSIWNANTDTLPQKVGKGLQHAGAQLLPSLTPGVGYGARRLQAAIEGRPNYYGEKQSVPAAAANALLGQKVVALDPKLEATKRAREVRAQLRELDEEVSIIRRNQSLTQAERREAFQDIQRKKAGILRQYQERQAGR